MGGYAAEAQASAAAPAPFAASPSVGSAPEPEVAFNEALTAPLAVARPSDVSWSFSIGVFSLAWAAVCSPWLLGFVTIPYDAKGHFQAQIQFLANALSSGESPFWNPHVFAGSPQIADPQSMIFSPALLLAWLFPSPSFTAVDAFVFGMLALGGVSIILLFRENNWRPVGGVVAALAFAFGGSASSRLQHVGQIVSLGFLMLALWLLVRTLRTRSLGSGAALGIATGLMLVEPDQVALLGCYAMATLALYEILRDPLPLQRARSLLPAFSLGGALTLAIAIVPLLLALLFVSDSSRPFISYRQAIEGSLHPASLLTGLVADLYGAQNWKIPYWGPFSDSWGGDNWALTQNMGQVYIGAAPILLILVRGLVGRQAFARDVLGYTIVAGGMLLYALGDHTPFFRFCYDYLPGVSGFRRPADATFLLGAMGAVLSGYLVHRMSWEKGDDLGDPRTLRAGAALVVGLLLVCVAVAWTTQRLSLALPQIAIGSAWLLAAIGALWAAKALQARAPQAALAALGLFVALDVGVNNGPNESTALPPAQYDALRPATRDETVRVVKEALRRSAAPDRRDRIEATGVAFHWANASMVHGFDNVLGYNPLRLASYSRATGAGDNVAGPDQRVFAPLFPSYRSRMADMLGLRYLVTGVPVDEIDPKARGAFKLIARTRDAYIYENPRALPRAMFLSRWRTADFETLIAEGAWPLFNPRTTVLLEAAPKGPARAVDAPNASASVRIVSYANTRVEIEVESDRPGLVLLNDVWHPWWTARLNGAPAPVLRANAIFRAVEAPAGHNRVVFEFRPFSGAMAELRARLSAPRRHRPD